MLKHFFKVPNNIEIVLLHSPQVSGQILLIESNQPGIFSSKHLYICFQRGHFRRWSGLSWQSKGEVKTEDAKSAECYSSKAARLLIVVQQYYTIPNMKSAQHIPLLQFGLRVSRHSSLFLHLQHVPTIVSQFGVSPGHTLFLWQSLKVSSIESGFLAAKTAPISRNVRQSVSQLVSQSFSQQMQ